MFECQMTAKMHFWSEPEAKAGDKKYRKVCEYLQRSREYTWHSLINTYSVPQSVPLIFTGWHSENYLQQRSCHKSPWGLPQGSGVQLELPQKIMTPDSLWIQSKRRRKNRYSSQNKNKFEVKLFPVRFFFFLTESTRCFMEHKNLLFPLTCCFRDVLYGWGTFVND